MDFFSKYLIQENQSVLEALKALNGLAKNEALTLFVMNSQGTMAGTLTDGDIRRGLINGLKLEEPVRNIMHRDFYFLESNNISIQNIHLYKERGVALVPVLNSEKKLIDVLNLKQQKSYLPIDAILMAGGKGERLRPFTEKTPKPLLPVGEKAIIDYNVDNLISYGIKHVSVTVNYLKEQIEKHFQAKRNGILVHTVREPKYLGTIGSVKFVPYLYNDVILIMNSDLFTNIDYEGFYLHFKENDADMSAAGVPYTISVPYGIFELNGRYIDGIREKPIYDYYANAGIYLIKRELLDLIPDDTFFNATDFMEMLIRQHKKVIRFPITGYWLDIGCHEEYKKAQELVKHL